jgi:hypothetical protein
MSIPAVADGLLHYGLNSDKWVKKLQRGPPSQKVVHPCITRSLTMTGNGSAINHTKDVLQEQK